MEAWCYGGCRRKLRRTRFRCSIPYSLWIFPLSSMVLVPWMVVLSLHRSARSPLKLVDSFPQTNINTLHDLFEYVFWLLDSCRNGEKAISFTDESVWCGPTRPTIRIEAVELLLPAAECRFSASSYANEPCLGTRVRPDGSVGKWVEPYHEVLHFTLYVWQCITLHCKYYTLHSQSCYSLDPIQWGMNDYSCTELSMR